MIKFRLILISILFISCMSRERTGHILYNVTFEEIKNIAQKTDKVFCIVLTDSTESMTKEYHYLFKNNFTFLAKNAIYNFVDVNNAQNEWYMKWLNPIYKPLTCVFSADGHLIDLIPGFAKETFLYSEKAIKESVVTDYHWPNQFGMNKKKVIPLLNAILKHRDYINQGISCSNEINPLIDSLQYPYSLDLKLIGYAINKDTLAMKRTAEIMLNYETSFNLILYRNEFIRAKKIINPLFDIRDEPNIKINAQNINLLDCKTNESIPINVVISNIGNKPLIINGIHISCSCLTQDNHIDNMSINAGDSTILKFHFKVETNEDVSRDIYINSNAINLPIAHINICAIMSNNN